MTSTTAKFEFIMGMERSAWPTAMHKKKEVWIGRRPPRSRSRSAPWSSRPTAKVSHLRPPTRGASAKKPLTQKVTWEETSQVFLRDERWNSYREPPLKTISIFPKKMTALNNWTMHEKILYKNVFDSKRLVGYAHNLEFRIKSAPENTHNYGPKIAKIAIQNGRRPPSSILHF